MVLSFLIIGMSFYFVLEIPEKLMELDSQSINMLQLWQKLPIIRNILTFFNKLFRSPKYIKRSKFYNLIIRIFFIFLNAIIGANGDYSAGELVWKPGDNWRPIFTFIVWFGGGIITLIAFYILKPKRVLVKSIAK
ncbi:MAG: hypothetical protein ACTSRZ_01335 [Promethearchaeota archaeon]